MAYGVNAPSGLQPYSSGLGVTWSERTNKYFIGCNAAGAGHTQSIFQGDAVAFITQSAHIGLGGNITTLLAAMNGGITGFPLGVFYGCEYYDPTGTLQKQNYWRGGTPIMPGTEIVAYVNDDPFTVWSIQASTSNNDPNDARWSYQEVGTTCDLGIADGGIFNPPNPQTGNFRTGMSGMYADGATNLVNPQNTRHLKVIGFDPDPRNQIPKSYLASNSAPQFLNLLVQFNVHVYKSVGVGPTTYG